MTVRVSINPKLFQWACERVGRQPVTFASQFPRLEDWINLQAQPTLKQLEEFAKATYVPVGYFFLPEPPQEKIPIPDFRTMGNHPTLRPSPDLLDTIYICQQRQEWYRDFARLTKEDPLAFVGSVKVGDDVVSVAKKIQHTLGFSVEERKKFSTWAEALRHFIDQVDQTGILVMCNGVVLNNNRRHLNPEEFRGFALADSFAPLIFINGADTKAAQMFTLAHELVHIWVGESALTDDSAEQKSRNKLERWCNSVAAELLVPIDEFRKEYKNKMSIEDEVSRLSRHFKVSTLVIFRRLRDIHALTKDEFQNAYLRELKRLKSLTKSGGGNFYLTQAARASKRFSRALIISTLEGQTLYRDAFRMLGFSKLETFRKLGESLKVV